MKAREVRTYQPGSAEYVVAQATNKRHRGRRPSAILITPSGVIRNPERALKIAHESLTNLYVEVGIDIDTVCLRLVQAARLVPVSNATHNGVTISARAGDTPEEIEKRWREQVFAYRDPYFDSPEYKAEQERNLEAHQRTANHITKLILHGANLSDRELVLALLSDYLESTDYFGVIAQHTKVVEAFLSAGYQIRMNAGEQFDASGSKDYMADFIIGQVLHYLQDGVSPYRTFAGQYEKWKTRFSTKKATIWWLLNGQVHPSLSEDDRRIASLISIVQVLFPGIECYSITGFSKVMHDLVIPVLQRLFPELIVTPSESVKDDETVELPEILPSDDYEWEDDPAWQAKFQERLTAL